MANPPMKPKTWSWSPAVVRARSVSVPMWTIIEGPPGRATAPSRACRRLAGRSAHRRQEVAVEQAEADGHADARDDPEPNHDVDLAPPRQLEVVLQGRHPEHPLAGGLERDDLDDHGHRDDDEQATEDDGEQRGAGGDREAADEAAQAECAGVAHEDAGRGRVPPQEAHAGPRRGAGDE